MGLYRHDFSAPGTRLYVQGVQGVQGIDPLGIQVQFFNRDITTLPYLCGFIREV